MKCYFHGSFMNDNFGDFLLYDIVFEHLKQEYPSLKVYSTNVSSTYDSLQDVHRIDKENITKEVDFAILGGGGYFGQPGRLILDQIWNYKFLKNHANMLYKLAEEKIPYIVVGAGVGPISWVIGQKKAKFIFEKAEKVVLRDTESRDYCKNILKVQRPIDVLPDLVMGCNIDRYLLDEPVLKTNQEKMKIAIHLTTKNKKNGTGIDLAIKDILSDYASRENVHYYILCDQKSEKQTSRATETSQLFKEGDATVMEYQNPHVLTTLLSEMDLIITDKLHVGIVGTKLKKHVISVSSHVKIGRFYNQMGRKNYSIRLKEIKENDVFQLIQSYPWELNDISDFIHQSEQNFTVIDDFVKRYVK